MTVTQAGQYEYTNEFGESILMGKDTFIRVDSVSGLLDWPDKQGTTEPYGDRHGGYYNAQGHYGVRRCIFTVAVHIEKDSEETHAVLEQLVGVLGRGKGDGYLTVQRPGKESRRLICHPIRTNFDAMWTVHQGLAPGAFELEAGDPLFYAEEMTPYGTPMRTGSSGRTYPRIYPLLYGALGEGGFIVVHNAGNESSDSVLRVHGPIDTPIIYNSTQERYLKFDISIPAGDYLEINTASHTALLNGTGNRRSTLNPLSQWWTLEPGDNEIRFQGNIYNPDALLEVEMRSAWATA